MNARAFAAGRDSRFYLLARHRQPLAENVAAHWIEAFTKPNDLIVDPFVASDAVVRAALGRGRRILAADSNPIVAWATRAQATLPLARDIHAALARLGDTRKEGETLQAFLNKLYASQCAVCGGAVVVDFFVWRRDGGPALLAEKSYTCAACGPRRDDATASDRERAGEGPKGLSYHLLLQRLLANDPATTPHVKRLLELYTPRNLNALAAVTQKLDADFRDDAAHNLLTALLLHALDVGTCLYPSLDAMPTREVPAEFVETNIWGALAQAAHGLSEHGAGLRLATSATQVVNSATPAALIGQGGARYLVDRAPETGAALILSSPARLDPRFWELSFLWTRWLLGRQAAMPLEPLLEDKRQRWSWYGDALTKSFGDAAKLVREGGTLVVAFPAGSHAMIEALMLAASPVFALTDFAFRPARGASHSTEWGALRGDYQAVWERRDTPSVPISNSALATKIRAGSLAAARGILDARGEPLAYSWLHHAALGELARAGVLAETIRANYREGDNAFQVLRHRMEEGFKEGYIEEIDHWEKDGRVLWLKRESGGIENMGQATNNAPQAAGGRRLSTDGGVESKRPIDIARRVEEIVRELLETQRTIGVEALDEAVLARLGGLLTPEIELVEMCAAAYADLAGEVWIHRAHDPASELAAAHLLTKELGERLGFRVTAPGGQYDRIWRVEKIIPGSASGALREERIYEDVYVLLFRARIDFDELLTVHAAPLRGLVVIAESQVALTRERMRRDPRWIKKLERAGWEFLRVPPLKRLLAQEFIALSEFQLALGLEPPLETGDEQMQLL